MPRNTALITAPRPTVHDNGDVTVKGQEQPERTKVPTGIMKPYLVRLHGVTRLDEEIDAEVSVRFFVPMALGATDQQRKRVAYEDALRQAREKGLIGATDAPLSEAIIECHPPAAVYAPTVVPSFAAMLKKA